MMPFWKLKFFNALLGLARNPRQTEDVFRLADLMRERASPEAIKQAKKRLENNAPFKALFESGDSELLSLPYDLEALEALPEESLGFHYAKFMRLNRLSPEFFPSVEGKDIISFLQTRIRKTHDIWHVLTDFEANVPGELGLMGFYLSQLESFFPIAILASGMLHLIGQGDVELLRRSFDEIVRGYQMGKASEKLYGVRFELLWEKNIHTIRRELGIVVSQSAQNQDLVTPSQGVFNLST